MQLSLFVVLLIFSISTAFCLKGRRMSENATIEEDHSGSSSEESKASNAAVYSKRTKRYKNVPRSIKTTNKSLRKPCFPEVAAVRRFFQGLCNALRKPGSQRAHRFKFWSKGKSRSSSASSRKRTDEESHEKPITSVDELHERFFMPFFTEDTADDMDLLRTLNQVAHQRAAFQYAEDERSNAASIAFLEKYCLPKGSTGDPIEPDDDTFLRLQCKRDCDDTWGFAFAPDTNYQDAFVVYRFTNGVLIKIAEGELELHPKYKKGRWNPEGPTTCVCNITEEFFRLLDNYGIDSKTFDDIQKNSWYHGRNFLKREFDSVGLKLVPHVLVWEQVMKLMEWQELPVTKKLTEKDKQQGLKEFRGESHHEASLDYWEGMEFYRGEKSSEESGDRSPTSEEYLKDLFERLGNIPEQPKS